MMSQLFFDRLFHNCPRMSYFTRSTNQAKGYCRSQHPSVRPYVEACSHDKSIYIRIRIFIFTGHGTCIFGPSWLLSKMGTFDVDLQALFEINLIDFVKCFTFTYRGRSGECLRAANSQKLTATGSTRKLHAITLSSTCPSV